MDETTELSIVKKPMLLASAFWNIVYHDNLRFI
jgi:hypothetical protein